MATIETVEVVYIGLAAFAAAAYFAMSARWDITQVPWYKFIRYPSYFAGRDQLLTGVGYFFLWGLLSVAICILLASLIKSAGPTVKYLYGEIGYNELEGGHAGLATLLFITLVSYHYIVQRTYCITIQVLDKLKNSGDAEDGSFNFVALYKSYVDSNPDRTALLLIKQEESTSATATRSKVMWSTRYWLRFRLKLVLDIVPLFLVPFYRYFYDSLGILLRGCTNILHQKYGTKTIIGFYDFHKSKADDQKKLERLDKAILECVAGGADHARTILCGKIGMKGYSGVKSYINNFVKMRSEEEWRNPTRRTNRTFFETYPRVRCKNSGRLLKGSIVECSDNGNGLFISTNKPLHMNRPIIIKLDKKTPPFGGFVVHGEAMFSHDRVVSGCGLKISDENGRRAISVLAQRSQRL